MDSAVSPILLASLVGLLVLLIFLAFRSVASGRDPMEERLAEYGLTDYVRFGNRKRKTAESEMRFSGLNRWLVGRQMGAKLTMELVRADVAITAGEFVVILAGLAGIGIIVGMMRGSIIFGIGVGAVLAVMPFAYLTHQTKTASKRLHCPIARCPDLACGIVASRLRPLPGH